MKHVRLEVPAVARKVIESVDEIISPVYLVGGSVRDMVLGQVPHDYDFTTPLKPEEVQANVEAAGLKAYTTGKRFGTIGFRCGEHYVEVTTFRAEKYTAGSRKPDVVFVDDVTHDLSRRDFTINAMALRTDGRLVDPFGGMDDINRRLIRTVGGAGERFGEDPLRMLRAARFMNSLGFDVDPDLELRAGKRAHQILEVSRERWIMELDRLIVASDPTAGLDFLARTRLLAFMIPELGIQVGFDQDSPYHELDLWQHTLKTVRLIEPDLTLRWAALLHDVGKGFTKVVNKRGYSNYSYHELVGAELVDKIGRYLKWPNERRETLVRLVRDHLEPGSPLHDADTAATRR